MAKSERSNPPQTKQDNQGKDNQGEGPLVSNKDLGRQDQTHRQPERKDSSAGKSSEKRQGR